MPTRSTGWSVAERAVLRSVLYASLFEYPLTIGELRRSLLELSLGEEEIARVYDSSARLRSAIEHRDGWFVPRGKAEWIARRRRRQAASRAFLQRHRRLLAIVSMLPFVRLVALSGSLAVLNADAGADLDLFVVTRGARAWSVTLAVVLLSKLLRCRKVVCLNFVLADTNLALDQDDFFSANQIIHLRPVAGLDAYREFVAANPFIWRWYPNFDPEKVETFDVGVRSRWRGAKAAIEAVLSAPSRVAEHVIRSVYGRYLRSRAGSWQSPDQVRLQPGCLKLHTRSHRTRVVDGFERLCEQTEAAAAVATTLRFVPGTPGERPARWQPTARRGSPRPRQAARSR